MSDIVITSLWMYGLAIVVSLLVAAVIKTIVVLLDVVERTPAAADAVRPAAAPAAMPDVAADHVAAIGAAVFVAIGAHRIVRIEDSRRGAGWVAGGRIAHHGSHAASARTPKH